MFYDEMYNAAYCDKCSEEMGAGKHKWADADYVLGLKVYTDEEFKAMMNELAEQKYKNKINWSNWICSCCEKPFLS